eukprot:c20318_g2_i1.p1 GENE.c20318_g2_i1~~c20318_g2_i1.p1  ORF type:complete len:232 (-),score=66.39 c20318_g2_i1:18-713(-)
MVDSLYEYMLKVSIHSNFTEPKYVNEYLKSSNAAIKNMLKTTLDGYTYFIQLGSDGKFRSARMEELVCFAGGMFALGSYYIPNLEEKKKHFEVGENLTRTCYEGAIKTKTGIAPESWIFENNETINISQKENNLRPETVESIFYMYRLTGDKKYLDWGWNLFQAIEKYAKVPTGYCGIEDVTRIPVKYSDRMESFFLAETLKYLYLLFSPTDLISLDSFVFNTEAHPFRRF